MIAPSKSRLQLVGSFRLLDSSGADITPRGQRAKALIAVLALSSDGIRGRKWIEGVLWSDRAPPQASGSLRQELSSVRKHLQAAGVDVLSADREVVRLDLDKLSIDLNDPASYYPQRDLLEGLDVGDPEFEDWLRDERQSRKASRVANDIAGAEAQKRQVPHAQTGAAAGTFCAMPGTLPERPCIGLVWDAPVEPGCVANTTGELFIDSLERTLQSFDAIDIFDFRTSHAQPSSGLTRPGPDWMISVAARPIGASVSLSVRLTSNDGQRKIWTQSRVLDFATLTDPDHLELSALVNDTAFVTVDTVLKTPIPANATRHEAARLSLGALYRIFGLRNEDLDQAENMLLRAYELEKKSSYLAWLLFIHVTRLGERKVGPSEPYYEQVREFARRAVESDPFNPISLSLAALAYSFVFQEYDYALDLADRAVKANPSFAIARDIRALTLGYLGDAERGYSEAIIARQLGGPPQYRYLIDTTCCILSAISGRFEESIRHGHRVMAQQPNYLPALRYTAGSYGNCGQLDAARATLTRLRELEPDFSLELLRDRDYPVAGIRGSTVIQEGLTRVAIANEAGAAAGTLLH